MQALRKAEWNFYQKNGTVTCMVKRRNHARSLVVETARRLRLTRQALGLSQADICRLCQIEPGAWNNNENARDLMSLSQAFKLKAGTGVGLDWIYDGELRHLPVDLAIKIQDLMNGGKPEKPKPRPRPNA